MSAKTSTSRRLLLPLATMAVAGAVVIGSGASFTSTTSTAASVVTAGAFTQTNTAENEAVFTLETVKPGAETEGTATVTNTGDFAGTFKLTEVGTNSFPTGDVEVTVTDITNPDAPVEIHSGDVGTLGTKDLGEFAVGEARTYDFDVVFAQEAGDDAQGAEASAVYTWDAVQAN